MTAQPHRFNLVLKPAGVHKLQAVADVTGKTKAQVLRDLLDVAYLMMREGHPHCVSGQVCLFPQSHPQLAQFQPRPPPSSPSIAPSPTPPLPNVHEPTQGEPS